MDWFDKGGYPLTDENGPPFYKMIHRKSTMLLIEQYP